MGDFLGMIEAMFASGTANDANAIGRLREQIRACSDLVSDAGIAVYMATGGGAQASDATMDDVLAEVATVRRGVEALVLGHSRGRHGARTAESRLSHASAALMETVDKVVSFGAGLEGAGKTSADEARLALASAVAVREATHDFEATLVALLRGDDNATADALGGGATAVVSAVDALCLSAERMLVLGGRYVDDSYEASLADLERRLRRRAGRVSAAVLMVGDADRRGGGAGGSGGGSGRDGSGLARREMLDRRVEVLRLEQELERARSRVGRLEAAHTRRR